MIPGFVMKLHEHETEMIGITVLGWFGIWYCLFFFLFMVCAMIGESRAGKV
jgi:hypothetical protein